MSVAKFVFYAPVSFEPWDFRTPDTTGIGGSETHVVEVSRRLAERGHDVTVYAPLAPDCPEYDSGGARWLSLESVDFSRDGLWIMCRCPDQVDKLKGQRAWVVCQDVEYINFDGGFTPARSEKIEKVLALCETQREYYAKQYPHLGEKLVKSSNGIRNDGIRATAAKGITRNPLKLVYFSSPDRGLIQLLKMFKRAREFEPSLALSVAYGLNNLKKCEGPGWRKTERDVERLVQQPGVQWLGRINQRRLWEELFSAGIWCYPTHFTETSCIACMEAQACGCVPIITPIWAVGENVGHGMVIPGDPLDRLVQARFVREILNLAWNPALQEKIRAEMMPWAMTKHSWDRIVDDWEGWLAGYTDCASWHAQYAFQLRHAEGRILNIGCSCDMPGFGKRGAINVDLLKNDPGNGVTNAADVIHDARQPLPFGREFDTAILGEILEHLSDEDAVRCLKNAAAVVKPTGKIIVTVPEDYRGPLNPEIMYAPGISGGHVRPITEDVLSGWLQAAGLKTVAQRTIEYGEFAGRGVVACAL